MSRISIEVSPEDHKAIKALALLEGVPIKALVWGPIEKKLRKYQQQAEQHKGYGAGDPDCPLCQKYAKSGRYNKKTERGLEQSRKKKISSDLRMPKMQLENYYRKLRDDL